MPLPERTPTVSPEAAVPPASYTLSMSVMPMELEAGSMLPSLCSRHSDVWANGRVIDQLALKVAAQAAQGRR